MSNKYHARKATINNITFDSRREASRYMVLLSMQQAGEIRKLACQPRWDLVVNGIKIGRYTGDFEYFDADGCYVVEDVKSKPTRTRDYVLRKKLMLALYKIDVVEVK
jgi:hypothetical protein